MHSHVRTGMHYSTMQFCFITTLQITFINRKVVQIQVTPMVYYESGLPILSERNLEPCYRWGRACACLAPNKDSCKNMMPLTSSPLKRNTLLYRFVFKEKKGLFRYAVKGKDVGN